MKTEASTGWEWREFTRVAPGITKWEAEGREGTLFVRGVILCGEGREDVFASLLVSYSPGGFEEKVGAEIHRYYPADSKDPTSTTAAKEWVERQMPAVMGLLRTAIV